MWPVRLAVAAALALGLLAAPGAGSRGSGLYGIVTRGPVRPVCQAGVPCDAPVSVTLVFTHWTDSSTPHTIKLGVEWGYARSDRRGRYRIALSPGIWTVRAKVKVGMSKLPRPHTVRVRSGHWDRIDLSFDTGIR